MIICKYHFNWVDSNCNMTSTGTVTIDTKHNFNVVDLPGYELTNSNGINYFDLQEVDCLPLCDPLVGRCWEVSENSLQSENKQILDVQGRLKASSKFWIEVLHAKPSVIDWIQDGYKLPLLNLPPVFYQANYKSAMDNHENVSGAIQDLLKYQCIQVVATRLHICSPLSVVINDVSKR